MEVGSHAVGCGTRPIASTCSTIPPVQYVRLLKSILNGDVEGFYNRGSMRRDILEAPPVTLSLVGGSPLICVRQRGRWQDRVITTPAAGATTSSLVLAALLWAFLASRWTLFPQEDTCRSPRTRSRTGCGRRARRSIEEGDRATRAAQRTHPAVNLGADSRTRCGYAPTSRSSSASRRRPDDRADDPQPDPPDRRARYLSGDHRRAW